ncbi:glycosyl transferase [Bacillus salacetis]|uniref:Glycosyl transferase n=1 Tax=Bacillus salacetis TaxID=2315464 RepID=A0A3A1R2B3_9BACI|nr:ATP-grasp fold amidoligase family protein [Bacillus salacetis]RIW36053.1 glycosyl transferase [Bacillus salacetis]
MVPLIVKKLIPDKVYLQLMYYHHNRRFINFRKPQSFSEKQQWLKLYNRKPEYTIMADKYAVRKYIEEVIGKQYLVPLVGGPWNCSDEIDISRLPEQFVLKCSNGHGVEICSQKDKFDFEAAKKRLEKSLRNNLFWYGREWPYKNSKSCIIAEEYLGNDAIDYKFYCFNGAPKYLFIVTNRFQPNGPNGDYFDMNGNHLKVRDIEFYNNPTPNSLLPSSFEEMKTIAQKLSQGIPFVRIDLYERKEKPIFGEITFFDSSGFSKFDQPDFDYELGRLIKLPEKKYN